MKNAFDYVVYLLFRGFDSLLSLLPLKAVIRFGNFIGWLCHAVMGNYRRLAYHNLAIAFGDTKTPQELRRLCRKHFTTLGGNLFAGSKIGRMDKRQLEKVVTIEGGEHLKACAESDDRGTVLVISHIGNWELIAQLGTIFPEVKSSTIYQALGNRYLDNHTQKIRNRFGVKLFDRKKGFDAPIRYLREGGLVGVLVDQHAGDSGIWTPLFHRIASTSPLAPMLAIRTQSCFLPMAVYTAGVGRWRVVFSPPADPVSSDVDETALQVNRILESQIRQSPHDWFWVHNRWKTPNPKWLLARYRRGIYLPESEKDSLHPFRILIRSSNWLGDAVMTVPAVNAIKQGRPDAHVTILCKSNLVDFWKRLPTIDDIITIDKSDTVFNVATKLREGNFEAAVVLPNSIRTGLEAWLAGIPRRVGYRGKWRALTLNQIIPADPDPRPKHQMHHYLRIAKRIGAKVDNAKLVAEKTEPHDPLKEIHIAICPGAEYGSAKRWPAGRFAEVVNEISKRREVTWHLVGTAKEQGIGEQIDTDVTGKLENHIGKTSLSELMDLLENCQLLLTNDTGTMHLASMLDTPVVAIFGSTEPELTGPIGEGHTVLRHQVECSPCFLRECPIDFRCMQAITADQVSEAVLRKI